MSTKMSKKLSPSWVEAVDPTSGRTYYANLVTKETTWVKPEAAIKAELQNHESSRKSKKKKDVWLERQDPATGKVYYYNPAKRETSWHRPDNTIAAGALQSDQGKGAWVERIDPRTGRTYYYNPVLGKTSWTNPDAEEEEEANKKKSITEGAFKRLSMGLNNASKRLSQGIANLSFGMTNPIRNSARYSLQTPIIPVNKTEGRQSLRLGANVNFGQVNTYEEALGLVPDDDRFAKLRAMKNQGALPSQQKTTLDLESFLKIDLNAEAEGLSWRIDLKEFEFYAQENFNQKKGGVFGGALDLTALRTYQRKPISKPLHNLQDKDLQADAIYAFKVILNFCGDKPSKKPLEYHAKMFLSYGNGTAAELQAEIYAQLIKQTTQNPHELSEERAWELIMLSCGTFEPPEKIKPYVLSHLRSAVETPTSLTIKKWAEYAMLRLERISHVGPRLEVPSEGEIDAARNHRPYDITVNLVSSTSINMQVDTWTTIKDVRKAMESRFQIKDGSPFAVFEVADDDNERVLEDTDRVMDLISFWEREKLARKKDPVEFMFVYKIRLFFDISEEDTAAIELAYLQAVYEVLDSRYPCTVEDCITLAAFEAQEKFGDYQGSDVFGDKLGAYLPQKFYNEEEEQDLKRQVTAIYKKFHGYDKLACMINYLNYVKNWKFYGSAYYFAEPITLKLLGKEFPKTVIIGINAKGILIIDPPTLDLIADYPYSEVVTWGHSAENVVFVVGNLVRSQKMFFKTKDGLEMNSLIHAYVDKLMEAQPAQENEVDDQLFY